MRLMRGRVSSLTVRIKKENPRPDHQGERLGQKKMGITTGTGQAEGQRESTPEPLLADGKTARLKNTADTAA